jgi:putative endonuclease
MYYVYLIKSAKDNELYTGSTNNLRRRIWEHNNGKNLSTKHRAPFSLIYYEAYLDESDARHRESTLKLRGNALAQLKRRLSQSLLRKVGVRV